MVEHRRVHGRNPAQSTKDGKWYANQKLHQHGMPTWRRAILDEEDPGWDDVRTTGAERPEWRPAFARHTELVARIGRPPVYSSDDPDEVSAYRWLWQQARRLLTEDPRRDELVTKIAGWDRDHGFWPVEN